MAEAPAACEELSGPSKRPPVWLAARLKLLLLFLAIGYVLCYQLCFYRLDLPNADVPGRPGEKFSRLEVWRLAIPGLVPGMRPLAADALSKFGDLAGLSQRLPVFAVAAAILLAALAAGYVPLSLLGVAEPEASVRSGRSACRPDRCGLLSSAERVVLAYGLGVTALSLLTLVLGLAGLLYRWLLLGLLAALLLAAAGHLTRSVPRGSRLPRGSSLRKRDSPSGPARHAGATLAARSGRVRGSSTEVPSRPDSRAAAQAASWAGGRTVGARYAGLEPVPASLKAAVLVVAAPFALIMLFGAALPATDFDAREYHLQGPKEFYLAGRISFVPHNVYCNMPFGTEMLTLLAMVVCGDWWWGALVGQVLLATFAFAGSLACYSLGCQLFSPRVGWLAAAVYITTPWVYRLAIIPYAEGALCYWMASGLLAVVLALRAGPAGLRLWLLAGALAGAAVGCKYTALNSTLLPLLAVAAVGPAWLALRARRADSPSAQAGSATPAASIAGTQQPCGPPSWRGAGRRGSSWKPVAALLLGAAVACGPWLAKNAALTGNPLYPLLYHWFDGRNWTEAKNAKWEWGHRVPLMVWLGLQRPPDGKRVEHDDPQHGITAELLARNLCDVTIQADWLSSLLFGFAPLAFLYPRRIRLTLALWLLVGYLFFQWWLLTHRLDRFWLSLLCPLAVLAAAGLCWCGLRIWRACAAVVFAAVVFYNFSYCSSALCGHNDYAVRLDPQRGDPSFGYRNPVNWMNAKLPAGSKVLAVGAADLFHLRLPVLYNTVFDDCLLELICRDRPNAGVRTELSRRGVTHVYVNWAEVARYRATYGYSEFARPAVFRQLTDRVDPVLVRIGCWGLSVRIGHELVPAMELYRLVQTDRL